MKKTQPRLLIYSSHAMILVDLHDMLKPQCQMEVVTCTSPAQALMALELQPFSAAIVDDTGEGPALTGVQQICGMLQTREVPFVSLVTSDDTRKQLDSATRSQANTIVKPVHETALRAAMARIFASSCTSSIDRENLTP